MNNGRVNSSDGWGADGWDLFKSSSGPEDVCVGGIEGEGGSSPESLEAGYCYPNTWAQERLWEASCQPNEQRFEARALGVNSSEAREKLRRWVESELGRKVQWIPDSATRTHYLVLESLSSAPQLNIPSQAVQEMLETAARSSAELRFTAEEVGARIMEDFDHLRGWVWQELGRHAHYELNIKRGGHDFVIHALSLAEIEVADESCSDENDSELA